MKTAPVLLKAVLLLLAILSSALFILPHVPSAYGQGPLTADFTFAPASPGVGDVVTFVGTATGGDLPYTFTWNFSDQTPVATGNPVTHSFTRTGVFDVRLTVTDSTGAPPSAGTVLSADAFLKFQDLPPPPSPNTPGTWSSGRSVIYDERNQGADNGVYNAGEPVIAGPVPQSGTNVNVDPKIKFVDSPSTPGTWSSGEKAVYDTNDNGLYDTTEPVITPNRTVSVTHPVTVGLGAEFTFNPVSPAAGDAITFTGTVNLTRGTPPFTFKWDFGDGSPSVIGNPMIHAYNLAKAYIVKMNVTDSSVPTRFEVVTHPVTVLPILGIDCGVGSYEGFANPLPPPAVIGDGIAVDAVCNWSGDADALTGPDGKADPLVSDSPGSSAFVGPPGTGGGFTAEVRVFALPAPPVSCPDPNCINGFDVAIRFDARYLTAVLFDQRGLAFGDAQPTGSQGVFTLASVIDNSNGLVRLGQVINGVTIPADANNGVTLFRIRFDVVGVGVSTLRLPCDAGIGEPCQVTNPSNVAVKRQDGGFDSSSFFDTTYGQALGFNINWTFTPSSPVPGSPLTLGATGSCTGCLGTLTYSWDTDSDGTADATGQTATITAPTTTLLAHRVVLSVSNGTVTANATRRLPLGVLATGQLQVAVTTAASLNGLWLGGVPSYSGSWRFCPGTGSTSNAICSSPNPSISPATDQMNTQAITYSFAGVYNNSLRITDTASRERSATTITPTFLVNVTGTPQAFTVTMSSTPASPAPGQSATLTASVTYDSAYPSSFRSTSFSYLFDFGDGTTTAVSSGGLSAAVTKVYSAKGTYIVRVVATERSGVAVSRIQEAGRSTLNVAFLPVSTNFSFNPAAPSVGTSVSFTATATGGTSSYTFRWDFGDGTTGTGSSVTHTYGSAGTYTVTLTVTDTEGTQQASTKTVNLTGSEGTSPLLFVGIGVGVLAILAGLFFFLRRRRRPAAAG